MDNIRHLMSTELQYLKARNDLKHDKSHYNSVRYLANLLEKVIVSYIVPYLNSEHIYITSANLQKNRK